MPQNLEVVRINAFESNYIWLLRDAAGGAVGVVDPGDAEAVADALAAQAWGPLTHIFITHHHPDHIGGLPALKARFPAATVYAAAADLHRIRPVDVAVADGDAVPFGVLTGLAAAVPGHTSGHLAYRFDAAEALFCGDTLFGLGCGRLFEGTPAQMWESLRRLRTLPAQTMVYCAHEYAEANARFACAVDPDNPALRARAAEIARLRADGAATVPMRLGDECALNPFLRADEPRLQAALGMAGADPAAVFARLRAQKDVFQG